MTFKNWLAKNHFSEMAIQLIMTKDGDVDDIRFSLRLDYALELAGRDIEK